MRERIYHSRFDIEVDEVDIRVRLPKEVRDMASHERVHDKVR